MSWKEITELVCSNLPDANLVAATAGAASAFAAFWTIRHASKARENERYLGYAVTTLERAFSALIGRSAADALPPSDRIGWLTAARLIEEYKSAKTRIKDRIILQECESHEDHWRHQFYLRLAPLAIGRVAYYSEGSDSIDPTSAIVVHAFASWPENKLDPIKRYRTYNEALERLQIHPKWASLEWYVNNYRPD